jgi:hypothetical protein
MPEHNDPVFVPLKIVGSEECPSFYANTGAIVMTQFDIQIVFGEVVRADKSAVTGRAVARVIMTPEHAQLLVRSLEARLSAFVAHTGPLRMAAVESVSGEAHAGSVADLSESPKALL